VNLTGRRKIIIIGIALFIIIAGVALFANNSSDKGTDDIKDITTGEDQYYDENSKQTISDPEGKTPDVYGQNPDAPIFLGTASLLDYGVASDQEQDMQFAIYQYFNGKNEKVKEVSVAVDTIAPVPRDRNSASTRETINFDIVVDRKTTYKVKMEYFDLVSIQLYLYDSTGATQLYDSGVVSNQHL
jgi:hypothetical protein